MPRIGSKVLCVLGKYSIRGLRPPASSVVLVSGCLCASGGWGGGHEAERLLISLIPCILFLNVVSIRPPRG